MHYSDILAIKFFNIHEMATFSCSGYIEVQTVCVLYATEMQREVGHPGYHGRERVTRQTTYANNLRNSK